MSNADLVRAAFEAVEAGDRLAFRRLYADDVELWVPSTTEALEPGVVRGADAVDRWYAKTTETWTEFRFGAAEVIDRDPYVIAAGEYRAVGRASGIPVRGPWLTVWGFREGRVITIAHHIGRDTSS